MGGETEGGITSGRREQSGAEERKERKPTRRGGGRVEKRREQKDQPLRVAITRKTPTDRANKGPIGTKKVHLGPFLERGDTR